MKPTRRISGIEYWYEETPSYDPVSKQTRHTSRYLGRNIDGEPVRMRSAPDEILAMRLRKPFTYRETFEVLAGEGIIPEPLAKDLANLAGFRNVLVHIYWNLDLKQVYAILQHDLDVLRAFSGIMKEYVAESGSTGL